MTKEEFAALDEEYDRNTTLMYRPPEMCDLYQRYTINEKIDIWMLGCVAFVLCFYKHPFLDAGKLGIVNAAFQIPDDSKYSDKMKDFIRLMLTPNPSMRPDIFQVIDILDNFERIPQVTLNVRMLSIVRTRLETSCRN
jgi:AP2-associated kinase